MLNVHALSRQRGLSLIEIMISIVVGMFLLIAAASLGINAFNGARDSVRAVGFHGNLQDVVTIMGRELRRAGFNAAGEDDTGNDAKYFRQIWFSQTTAANSGIYRCVVFRYDRNVPTSIASAVPVAGAGTVATNEVTGLRFDATAQQAYLLTGATAINTTNCTGTGWEPLNLTSNVAITSLTFTPKPIQALDAGGNPTGAIMVESVTIDITGTDASGNTRTLSETVQLRNLPACPVSATRAGTKITKCD
ncbi:prepilin-type N-terminal cleavage/methylation domain-containing protein [Chitiniphilus purpureus]|uniref:Prepilin-type N-terminal cleavage/methylation domain-containing protein n=1 Tax=Chitiniphilus purpureus TaxID=2981137 RepID=A0ABY6DIP0_9NEIS|nr:prepilin-type N-terminal cleavage/methylation domain-containing protein [Chitiniphilus sp. CD1]UXY14224.1 prepilin-type N-terminal cleavage/methylation domain-containing protein [Chitiniphilus sp. CD1]